MDTTILAQIEQQAEQVRERVRQVKSDICSLLAADLPAFVSRELKKGFLEHTEFAGQMSDDTLKKLKADMEKKGTQAAQQVLDSVQDEALWFVLGSGQSISDNATLWNKVSEICATVDELKRQYAFPDGSTNTVYKAPTWFIEGHYLPTLSEKYWSSLSELAGLNAQLQAAQSHSSQSDLAKRWDKF